MVHITVMRKEETKYCKNTKLCFWYCDTHKLFFPCCLVVQNMMHGKVTNTQWMSIVGLVGALIMVHGLIVLMVLDAIKMHTMQTLP